MKHSISIAHYCITINTYGISEGCLGTMSKVSDKKCWNYVLKLLKTKSKSAKSVLCTG